MTQHKTFVNAKGLKQTHKQDTFLLCRVRESLVTLHSSTSSDAQLVETRTFSVLSQAFRRYYSDNQSWSWASGPGTNQWPSPSTPAPPPPPRPAPPTWAPESSRVRRETRHVSGQRRLVLWRQSYDLRQFWGREVGSREVGEVVREHPPLPLVPWPQGTCWKAHHVLLPPQWLKGDHQWLPRAADFLFSCDASHPRHAEVPWRSPGVPFGSSETGVVAGSCRRLMNIDNMKRDWKQANFQSRLDVQGGGEGRRE